MYINRTLEKNILLYLSKTKKINIIYGARQVGKSTLANKIIETIGLKTITINGEKAGEVRILETKSVENYNAYFSGYQLLFIDEAQYIHDIGHILKLIYDHTNLKVIVSGSSSFLISDRTSEPLTGRKLSYILYPFSVDEIRQLLSPVQIANNLNIILTYGLYPDIFLTDDIKLKQKLLIELTDAYLFKDIFALNFIKNPEKLRKLIQLLALQTGQLVSVSELASSLQTSSETVLRYIELLEKAYIVFRLLPYGRNLRKQIKKKFKIYFYDIGIRNAVINDFRPIDLRQDKGSLWENFIVAEIIKRSANLLENERFFYWRNYAGAEVDIVRIKNNGEIIAYEIKTKTKHKSPPRAWVETEPNAKFFTVDMNNFFTILNKI